MATTLTISVLADVAKAAAGIDQIDKRTASFTDGLKRGAAAIGSFLALDKIQSWANEWLGAARDASKATRTVGIVFEEAAGDIEKWAKQSANAIGLTSTEAKNLATGIGNQLRGYGLDTKQAADATTELSERAAHVAYVLGKDVGSVLDTVGAALRGRTAGIKELGVNLSATEINARLAAKGLGELEGQEATAAQATEVLAMFMERTAHMAGAIKPGGLKELTATTEELKITLGEALLPVVNKIIPPLLAIANWAKEHPGLFQAVTFAVLGIATAFGIAAAAAAALAVATLPLAGTFLLVAAAVIALTALIVIIVRNWETLVGWLRFAWEWLNRVVEAFGPFAFLLGPLGIAISLVQNFGTAWRAVETAIRAVISAVEWVMSKLSGLGGILSRIPGIGGRAIGPGAGEGAGLFGVDQVPGFGGPGFGVEINVEVAGNVGDPVVLGRRIVEALNAYVDAVGRRELALVVTGR
jgi:hypothetical protein